MGPDEHAEFRAFVQHRGPVLLRTAYLITGHRHDAEDLLQTALAKTWLAWRRIEDKRALDSYVRRVMANEHTSRWRKRKVDEYPADELPERSRHVTTRSEHDDLDLADALWAALASLPRRQRVAVVLRYYEGLTEVETAEVLGISVGTVKSAVSRALAKLRGSAAELGLRDDAGDVDAALTGHHELDVEDAAVPRRPVVIELEGLGDARLAAEVD